MREVMRLDGHWRFCADLDPEYHATAGYVKPDWDRRHWDIVPVPGCWNKYAERYALFEGVGWFAREFDVKPDERLTRAVLRFEGVNYEARVFLNGQLVGEHEGGYTEFTCEASAALRPGRNVLVVRVDNRRNRIKLPAVMGWFNYGGIHRSVQLERTGWARIEQVLVDAVVDGGRTHGEVRVRVTAQKDERLMARAAMIHPSRAGAWDFQWPVEPTGRLLSFPFSFGWDTRWCPEQPGCYECQMELHDASGGRIDRVSTTFGVREVRVQGRNLLLNGQPLWLKGVCCLGDHPATGVALNPSLVGQDFDHIQSLGINALRTHYPMPRWFLDECDRRGLLVWLEAPIYCLAPKKDAVGTAFADPAYLALARQMMTEMIAAAYNHPSVIIWSMGNECATDHPEAAEFFKGVADAARQLDGKRPLGYACLYGLGGCAADLADIVGMNAYWGWYDRIGRPPTPPEPIPLEPFVKALQTFRERYEKPLLMTEFGADAAPGYVSAAKPLWSEDYQAAFLAAVMQTARPFVCGTFPFDYQDYPDPSKPVNDRWAGVNLKGLVSLNRAPKLACAAVRDFYGRT